MDVFGWGLFVVGALLLVLFAVIGIDTGELAVANLAGTLVGSAMMISGAVFVAGSRIEQALRSEPPSLTTGEAKLTGDKNELEEKVFVAGGSIEAAFKSDEGQTASEIPKVRTVVIVIVIGALCGLLIGLYA